MPSSSIPVFIMLPDGNADGSGEGAGGGLWVLAYSPLDWSSAAAELYAAPLRQEAALCAGV